jgi:hypothetical protein
VALAAGTGAEEEHLVKVRAEQGAQRGHELAERLGLRGREVRGQRGDRIHWIRG